MFAKSAFEPIQDGGELDEGEEDGSEFIVASAEAAMALDAAEEVFDPMTAAVKQAGEGA